MYQYEQRSLHTTELLHLGASSHELSIITTWQILVLFLNILLLKDFTLISVWSFSVSADTIELCPI